MMVGWPQRRNRGVDVPEGAQKWIKGGELAEQLRRLPVDDLDETPCLAEEGVPCCSASGWAGLRPYHIIARSFRSTRR